MFQSFERSDLVCKYRRGTVVPYNLYKEEILGTHPRISQVYDVISDAEADAIKKVIFPKVSTAIIGIQSCF